MRPLQLNVIAGDPSDTAVYSQDYYIHQGYRGENRLRFWISSRFPTAPIRININNDAVDDLDQRTFTLKVLAPSVTITNSIDYERRPSSIWEIDTGAYESLKRTNPAPYFFLVKASMKRGWCGRAPSPSRTMMGRQPFLCPLH